MSESASGYVYFIRQSHWVKIGYSKDPHARMRDLQVASPTRLHLLMTEPGTQETERRYHDRFSRLRGSGEWFMYLGELREMLKGCEQGEDDEPCPMAESIRLDCGEGASVLSLREHPGLGESFDGAEKLAAEWLARHASMLPESGDLLQYIDAKSVYEETRPCIERALDHCLPDALSVSPDEVRFYYVPFAHIDEHDDWDDDKVPPCNHDAIIDIVDIFDYYRPELDFRISMIWDVGDFFRVPMRFLRKKLVGDMRIPVTRKRSWLDVYTGDEGVRDQ